MSKQSQYVYCSPPPQKMSDMSDKELIEHLKAEVRRVKEQRNQYEQELLKVNREVNRLRTDLTLLENYVNRKRNLRN